MPLTQSSIQDIYSSGYIENTDLANSYHEKLRVLFSFDIIASYYREISDSQLSLTLLCANGTRGDLTLDQKIQCMMVLHSTMDEHHVIHQSIDKNQIKLQRIREKEFENKLIPSFTPYIVVTCESFERLGKWHICSNAYAAKCLISLQSNVILRVIPYSNDKKNTFLIILSQPITENMCLSIKDQILELIAPYDPFRLFSPSNFEPVFRLKKDISLEEYRMLTLEYPQY